MSDGDAPERVPLSVLSGLLAPSLGQEKAEATVAEAAEALGLEGPDLAPEEAQHLLEKVSESPGIVGTVARFAKARLVLKYPGA